MTGSLEDEPRGPAGIETRADGPAEVEPNADRLEAVDIPMVDKHHPLWATWNALIFLVIFGLVVAFFWVFVGFRDALASATEDIPDFDVDRLPLGWAVVRFWASVVVGLVVVVIAFLSKYYPKGSRKRLLFGVSKWLIMALFFLWLVNFGWFGLDESILGDTDHAIETLEFKVGLNLFNYVVLLAFGMLLFALYYVVEWRLWLGKARKAYENQDAVAAPTGGGVDHPAAADEDGPDEDEDTLWDEAADDESQDQDDFSDIKGED